MERGSAERRSPITPLGSRVGKFFVFQSPGLEGLALVVNDPESVEPVGHTFLLVEADGRTIVPFHTEVTRIDTSHTDEATAYTVHGATAWEGSGFEMEFTFPQTPDESGEIPNGTISISATEPLLQTAEDPFDTGFSVRDTV